MSDLMELYQELILDHNRQPRNRGTIEDANHAAEGFNPLCGDRVTISLRTSDGVIDDIRFESKGCAISTASASLMSEAVKGRTIEEAKRLFDRFRRLMTQDDAGAGADDGPPLGKLEALSGVGRFPARVKCATLAWHTLAAALKDGNDVVTTE